MSTKGMKFGPMSIERRMKIGEANSRKIIFCCDYCGAESKDKPSSFKKKKRHFCSMKCYANFRAQYLPKEEQHRFGTGTLTDDEKRKRAKARSILNHHLRDKNISRPGCEVCGVRAEAHHVDYNKPLEVRWLCFKHHRKEHGQLIHQNPDLLK